MKLLYCDSCHDIFKPGSDKIRTCECGRVQGRYIGHYEVEVSPEAISIGIGNQALMQAIEDMRRHQAETHDEAERYEYYKVGNGIIRHAWVRPNTGPGNPHTRLIETDEGLDRRYLRMPLPDKHKITPELRR